jgi:hypothetical protein
MMGMRKQLAAGEAVASMCQEPRLASLQRQAEVAENFLVERQAALSATLTDLTSEDWTGPDHGPGPAGGSDPDLT